MKRIIQIVAFILFALALSGLMGFIYLERENQMLDEINVRICRDTENGFINAHTIQQKIEATDSIRMKRIKEIDTRNLEQIISGNPYVQNVDVFVNIDNHLMVNVREKKAVVRVFNQDTAGYYIDENGGIIPLSKNFTALVLIANGYINVPSSKGNTSIYDSIYQHSSKTRSNLLSEIFTLTTSIQKNNLLQALISQIYVNSKGEFDLIPQLGKQIIHFGNIENVDKKLDKLEIFYKKALVKEGWEKYKTIDLKYRNQVVCTKK